MKATFEFKSVGKKHEDEIGFFNYLVRQKFNEEGSRVIQWCKVEGLTITIEALTDEVVEWGKETIKNGFQTPTGYNYILK